MAFPDRLAAEFADRVVCTLGRIESALNPKATTAGPSAAARVVRASDPSFRRLEQGRAGELAGENPMRTGFFVHNASDGTLLIGFGQDDPTPRSYALAVGPGEVFSTKGFAGAEVVKGRIAYAFVAPQEGDGDEWDLSVFPAGLMLTATAGALSYTELTLKRA